MDSFDADVLIYAATSENELGRPVRALLDESDVCTGSLLLLPELLTKPSRAGWRDEYQRLLEVLSRIRLLDFDETTAGVAVALAVKYGLLPVDAAHLATAVNAGADRFITNNRRDFSRDIDEIDVIYPTDL